MRTLNGQVAVVTGAGSGIGQAIARSLAALGASLTLVGRRRDALEAVRADLCTTGATARIHPADVSREQDLRDLAATLHGESPGRVDILVHSAGVIRPGAWTACSPDDFDEQYRTNCRGPFLLTQFLMPTLREHRGQIVFINSSVGLKARPGVGAYAATKHALKALADSLRDEVNADGVRVLSVYCGRTATPMQAALHERERHPYRPECLLQAEDVAQIVVAALGLPRTAEVTDIHIRPMQGGG